MARFLKTQNDCDLIIALTHMRLPEDENLAEQVEEVDFILGGHDHTYVTEVIQQSFVIKSGTDFEEFNDFSVMFGVT